MQQLKVQAAHLRTENPEAKMRHRLPGQVRTQGAPPTGRRGTYLILRRQVSGLPQNDIDKNTLVVGVEEIQGRLTLREDVKADLRVAQ